MFGRPPFAPAHLRLDSNNRLPAARVASERQIVTLRVPSEVQEVEVSTITNESRIIWVQDGVLKDDAVGVNVGKHAFRNLTPVLHTATRSGKRRHMSGLYYWPPTEQHVGYESQAEREALMWLEFEHNAVEVYSRPFILVFGRSLRNAAKVQSHTPGFFAIDSDGAGWVIDVPRTHRKEGRERTEFALTAQLLDQIGWGYDLFTGYDEIRTANLRWIRRARLNRCAPSPEARERILRTATSPIPRSELAKAANLAAPQTGLVWIDYLTFHRELTFDMSHLLHARTEFWATPGTDEPNPRKGE